jgi:phage host-nuclease inhibitor protein Gam
VSPKYEQQADFDAASGADEVERERRADLTAEIQAGREFSLDEPDLSDATQARPEDVARQEALTRWEALDAEPLASSVLAVPAEEPRDGPGWDKATSSIVSLDGLNWAGGVLREIRAAMAANEEMARGEIEALEHKLAVARLRLDRAQKPLKADAEFFERAIETYAQAHKAEILNGYGKRKSRRLPSGLTVAYRAVGGEYRWRQDMTPKEREEELLGWALENDLTDFLKAKREPDYDAVKRWLGAQAAGFRAPPGLEWVPEGETVKVVVGEEK